jgi:serine/threonine-protein kinase HipA
VTDASAVVWTGATGEPRKLGLLVKTASEARFTYDRQAGDLPGISVVHDTKLLSNGQVVTFERSENNDLPPMFQALIPPADPTNLQRRILRIELEKETPLAGLSETDVNWLMLMKAGRDAIGHLDVFASDDEARGWYAEPTPTISIDAIADRPLWKMIVEASSPTASPLTLDRIIEALKVHPSPGGVMPKILARVQDGQRVVDELIKLSAREYPHVLALEDIAYDFHQKVGTVLPLHKFLTTADGIEVLAVERFDRKDGIPIPVESIFCALYAATNGSPDRVERRWSQGQPVPNLEMVAELLRSPMAGATVRPNEDCEEFYKRQVMALLTGNGDNHLENSAILGRRGEARLSPLFDPAPMRGYFDKRMVSCVSFSGVTFHGANMRSEIGHAIMTLGTSFGLTKARRNAVVEHCLEATADFGQVVRDKIPAEVSNPLLSHVDGVRTRIESALAEAKHRPMSAPKPDNEETSKHSI